MTHGLNCTEDCGACADKVSCDPFTGHCPGDCQDGFHGDDCKTCKYLHESLCYHLNSKAQRGGVFRGTFFAFKTTLSYM